jgi:hypothetical protein
LVTDQRTRDLLRTYVTDLAPARRRHPYSPVRGQDCSHLLSKRGIRGIC